MASALGGVVEFLKAFGFFDIVLPFLLIFTITFAVFEKSKIFGSGDGKANQRIDAMVAFVIALFFVAVPSLVSAIQISLPQIMMLLVVLVMFMMLIGALSSGKHPLAFFGGEGVDDSFKFWKWFFYILIFLGVSAIFLNSFGWLDPLFDYVQAQWDQTLIVSLIFLLIIVITIVYVINDSKTKS